MRIRRKCYNKIPNRKQRKHRLLRSPFKCSFRRLALKKLSWYKKKTWESCSKYVRLLHSKDGYCICYTCGKVKPIKEIQAGHGFSGRHSSILFELSILRPQCFQCNCLNTGRLDIFTYKLRKELGDERYEELWEQRNQNRQYTIPELIELRESFEQKFKELQCQKQ